MPSLGSSLQLANIKTSVLFVSVHMPVTIFLVCMLPELVYIFASSHNSSSRVVSLYVTHILLSPSHFCVVVYLQSRQRVCCCVGRPVVLDGVQ